MVFEQVAEKVFGVVRLSWWDRKKFLKSAVAKAITMAPYVCGAKDADRYAIQNGITFCAALKCKEFLARHSDFQGTVERRLESVFNFPGDRRKKGILKARLVVRMLSDMKEDLSSDKKNGKYNPYLLEDVDESSFSEQKELAMTSDVDVNRVFTQEESTRAFWWD
jgi:hypothetical protein